VPSPATLCRMDLAAAAAALSLAAPLPAHAFVHTTLGDEIPNPEMEVLAGGAAKPLGKARANVFVFFRPGQDHSLQVLRQLAQLEREFAGKPVRFAAIASASDDRVGLRAMAAEAGIKMPVLLDRDDELYGTLGVIMHPVVGIADQRQRLAADQHFLRVNMLDVLRARIQQVLGEIGEAEVAKVLQPPKATSGGVEAVARRRLHLARMLLERGHADKATENARAAVAAAPSLAEAHATLAQALAAGGHCAEAEQAHAEARRLDPRQANAAPACKAR